MPQSPSRPRNRRAGGRSGRTAAAPRIPVRPRSTAEPRRHAVARRPQSAALIVDRDPRRGCGEAVIRGEGCGKAVIRSWGWGEAVIRGRDRSEAMIGGRGGRGDQRVRALTARGVASCPPQARRCVVPAGEPCAGCATQPPPTRFDRQPGDSGTAPANAARPASRHCQQRTRRPHGHRFGPPRAWSAPGASSIPEVRSALAPAGSHDPPVLLDRPPPDHLSITIARSHPDRPPSRSSLHPDRRSVPIVAGRSGRSRLGTARSPGRAQLFFG